MGWPGNSFTDPAFLFDGNPMRSSPLLLCLLVSSLAWGAESASVAAEAQIKEYAKCYAYYTMSHFLWGSRSDRARTRFYLERTELSYLYASQLGDQHGIDETVWANSSLVYRNIMMSEIGQDLNLIPTLSRSYEPGCEALMAQIPPEVKRRI